MERATTSKVFNLKWLLSALYGLVMMEFVIMVSPFAFYWYSLYAPTLQGLQHWRATAWLEAFFLPHSVITTSPALEFLRWEVGTYCFSFGLLGFGLCAAQVYGAKLFRRGRVDSWIYSRIRHPQYLCLVIAAAGLLTIWPRIIILALFAGMLLFYYFLARFEEHQMEAMYADYAEYRKRTAMFIPGNPGGKLFRFLFGRIPNRYVALAVSSTLVAGLVITGGLWLRRYTINHSSTELFPADRTMAISIWPLPDDQIQKMVSIALEDNQVRRVLDHEPGAVFTAHLLPADYGMVDMFADMDASHGMFSDMSPYRFRTIGGLVFPFLRRNHRNRMMGTPRKNYRVIISRVDGPDRRPVSLSGITSLEAKMTPVVIADIGGDHPTLQHVVVPSRRSFWGDITMPMF